MSRYIDIDAIETRKEVLITLLINSGCTSEEADKMYEVVCQSAKLIRLILPAEEMIAKSKLIALRQSLVENEQITVNGSTKINRIICGIE